MKVISWNVNGLRSIISKNILPGLFADHNPDILCLQETRCPCDTLIPNLPSSYLFSHIFESDKKGYAGVGIFSKIQPISIVENELIKGRCICLEFEKFFIVNLYVPNSKNDLSALPFRTNEWEPKVLEFIKKLQLQKNVIVTGDFNVAPTCYDTHSRTSSTTNGVTPTERKDYEKLLKEGNLIDVWRDLNPSKKDWTWFSNFGNARAMNKGWRIDMILMSKALYDSCNEINANILTNVIGSDHVPLTIEICSSSDSFFPPK